MNLNQNNKKYQLGLIGKNIQNSLSPIIHKYFLNQQNIKANYNLIDKDLINLNDNEIINLFLSGYIGFNITSPFKESFLTYKNIILKEDAIKIKSINTLLKDDNNKIIGYNTDIYGFNESIKYLDLINKNILILGAGGTSRTVIYSLHNKNNIYVLNRTEKKIDYLKNDFHNIKKVEILDKNFLNKIHIVINTTTKNDKNINLLSINDLKLLNKNCIIYDINYNSGDTLLIKESKKLGLKTIDGLSMLINQAAKSFFYWFKVLPNITEELNQILLKELQKK